MQPNPSIRRHSNPLCNAQSPHRTPPAPLPLDLPPLPPTHPALPLPRQRICHQHRHRDDHDRDRNEPKEGIGMLLHPAKALKVLAKVSDEESQGQEEDGDCGEDLHGLVLVGAHDIEDEVYERIGCAPHLVQRSCNHDAVVFDVAEIGMRQGRDGDAGHGLARREVAVRLRQPALRHGVDLVVAQRIDDRHNGLDGVAEDGQL